MRKYWIRNCQQVAILGAVLCLLAPSRETLAAAPKAAGIIKLIKGEVEVHDAKAKLVADTAGSTSRKLGPGSEFYVGETVVTKASGRVKLQFTEGKNEVVLGTNTSLLIERASTDAAHATGTSLSLARGEVRSTVNHKYSGQGKDVYEVKTPNAVAGVRGTVFLARFNPVSMKSDVATERGLVAVRSLNAGGAPGREVMVKPGMFTSAVGAAAPAAPAPISTNKDLEGSVKSLSGGDSSSGDSDSASGSDTAAAPSKDSSSDNQSQDNSDKGPAPASSDQKQDAKQGDGGNGGDQPVAQKDGGANGGDAKGPDQKGPDQKGPDQNGGDGKGNGPAPASQGDSSNGNGNGPAPASGPNDSKGAGPAAGSGDGKGNGPAPADGGKGGAAAPANKNGNNAQGGNNGNGAAQGGSATASNGGAGNNGSSQGPAVPLGREPVVASSSGAAGRGPASVPTLGNATPSPAGIPAAPVLRPAGPPPVTNIVNQTINQSVNNVNKVNQTVNQQTQQVQYVLPKVRIKVQ